MTAICDELTDKLTGYLDKELPEEEMQRIDAHLKHCPTCRQELQELTTSSDMISEALSNQPIVDFDKAWQHIEAEIQCRPSIWQYFRTFFTKPGFWIPAGAAGAVGAAALILALSLPVNHSHPPAQVSRVESVSSKTGNVMVLQTAKTSQPIIWIMDKS